MSQILNIPLFQKDAEKELRDLEVGMFPYKASPRLGVSPSRGRMMTLNHLLSGHELSSDQEVSTQIKTPLGSKMLL